ICSPECLNGGRCIGHNSCLCPKEYRGSRCEYAYSNCDGHDRFASVGWKCEMTQKETICNVSCPARSTKLQPSQPTTYTCSLDGTWQPDLKPICVQGTATSQYERYENGQHGSGWQHNSGSSSHQMNRYRQNLGGYRSNEGQDQTNNDYGYIGQQQVDYDFGGQQQIGHEFGGQQQIGHEFGGQQSIDDDEDDDHLNLGKQITEKPHHKVQQTYEEAQKRPEGNSLNIQDNRRRQGQEDFDVNLPPGKEDGTEEEIDESFKLLDEDGREVMNEIVSISIYIVNNKCIVCIYGI
ncbi:EGF-like domain-containing protein, partial [Trichonephila inaurata madagascariensis]